jgi:pilus assembly protein Flp/PilA
MRDLAARLVSFNRDESGAAAAEYAMLIAALVVLVAVAAATLGDSLTVVLQDAADCVEVGCI